MKQVIRELYWAAISDLDKLKKAKMSIGERAAWERAIARLDAIKRIFETIEFKQ